MEHSQSSEADVVAQQPAAKKVTAKKAIVNKPAVPKPLAKKPVVKKVATTGKVVVKKTSAVKANAPLAEKAMSKPAAQPLEQSNEKNKVKKPKLIRDSFTIPENEYQALADLKKQCLKAGVEIKKSDLIRIGIASLKVLSVVQLRTAKDALQKLKVGRPKK